MTRSGRSDAATVGDDAQPLAEESLFASDESASMRRVLMAALSTFADLGFHGTATRDVARRAHVSPAGLYTHYESKQALLQHISRVTHEAMLDRMRVAAAGGGSATECLRRIVIAHVRFHAKYSTATRVANYELHSLIEPARSQMRRLRDEMELTVSKVVDRGCRSGEFAVADQQLVTMYIVSLGIDVSRWFRPGHRLSPDAIADEYANLVLRAISKESIMSASPAGLDAEASSTRKAGERIPAGTSRPNTAPRSKRRSTGVTDPS